MASLTWLEDGIPKVARLEPGTAYVLGREESVDIPVASPAKTISRRHARISVRGATCSIENLSETALSQQRTRQGGIGAWPSAHRGQRADLASPTRLGDCRAHR